MAVTINGSSGLTANDGSVFTNASGNVGIGTSSPGGRLDVAGGFARFQSSAGYVSFGDNGYIRTDSPGFLQLQGGSTGTRFMNDANDVERMRIDSSGNLLVGQASGSFKLSVTGTVYLDNRKSTGYNSSSAATLGVFGASNDASVNSGAVYNIEWLMSGSAGGQFWYANYLTRGGSRTLGAYCTGTTWTNASDIANKEAIAPIGYGLETVMAANPVDFRWKTMKGDDGLGKKDIGFIAQDMELIVPEVVTGGEGQKGISYGSLVAVAFKAIQELKAINDAQAQTIESLTARVVALEGQA